MTTEKQHRDIEWTAVLPSCCVKSPLLQKTAIRETFWQHAVDAAMSWRKETHEHILGEYGSISLQPEYWLLGILRCFTRTSEPPEQFITRKNPFCRSFLSLWAMIILYKSQTMLNWPLNLPPCFQITSRSISPTLSDSSTMMFGVLMSTGWLYLKILIGFQ